MNKKLKKMQARAQELLARNKEIREMEADQVTQELREELSDNLTELDALKVDIENEKRSEAQDDYWSQEDKPADPVTRDLPADDTEERGRVEHVQDNEASKPFKNLGEQLRAIYFAAVDRSEPVDKRLLQINDEYRAASGMSEGKLSDGGYALQQDFAGMMFDTAVSTGEILSKIDTYPIGAGFNGAKWVEADESSVATTVFGGVQVYWKEEGGTVAASKPKMRERKMELETLFGLAYATDELLSDTTFVSNLYNRAFNIAIQRKLEGDVIAGTGVGCLQGILKSGALVQVSKEQNQQANTVLYENFVSLWSQRWLVDGAARRLEWWVHPDVEAKMMLMEFPVGTGGIPVYLPPGGAADTPYSRLFGRPVIPTDHCSALSSKGDVFLVDPMEYVMIRKGGTQMDTSIHVMFLTGEQTFRFSFRANGGTKRQKSLTIKNSSNARSPFLVLQAR